MTVAAGREVELTATEYELLRVLSLNAGRVVAYDALLRRVWSGRKAGEVNLVRNFVKKLRAKLGDDDRGPRVDPQRARRRLPHAEPRGRGAPHAPARPAGARAGRLRNPRIRLTRTQSPGFRSRPQAPHPIL